MTVALKALRLNTAVPIRTLAVSTKRLYHSSTPRNMNSTTAAYQTSFGAEGNLGVAPKQMAQIQNLQLNDGNEIPMVLIPTYELHQVIDMQVAGIWTRDRQLQGRSQFSN